jgi:hypothetical protein
VYRRHISNWRHQLSVYADDASLPDENINTITKNTGTLLEALKQSGLGVNAETMFH